MNVGRTVFAQLIDYLAPTGNGATRSLERVAAAMGALESAPIEFQAWMQAVRALRPA
jgi:hypothetical protein